MKAIVLNRYGSADFLEPGDVETPVPRDDEVLVRVHAVSINDWDWQALLGTPFINRLIFGLLRPKKRILGSDIAGRVEATGRNVTQFRPGNAVFGDLSGRWGGFAEYVCAPQDALALKPDGMSFEQAAAVPQAGLLALQGLRDKGRIRQGQSVLINGAGGGTGTFAVQIAKLHGAEITAVDAPDKLARLRAMGAAHVIDYTREDFTRGARRYDLVLDVKTNRPVFHYARALKPGGTYVTVGGDLGRIFLILLLGPWLAMLTKKKLRILGLKANRGLADMVGFFEAGTVVPVVDGSWKLSDLPEAMRYFGRGRHQGKVVITVANPDDA